MSHQISKADRIGILGPKVEKIDVTYIFQLKHSSRSYYITIPIELVRQYELVPGQFLKIHIKEVRRLIREDEVKERRELK